MKAWKIAVTLCLALGAGLCAYLAWWTQAQALHPAPQARHLKYQCPMHPQIVSDEPGECPICHMHLQLVEEDGSPAAGDVSDHAPFTLSQERRQLIGVRSQAASVQDFVKTLRLPGRVEEEPRRIMAQALEMDGPMVKAGQDALVWVSGEGERGATVVSVDRALDAFSRTFGVRLALRESPGSGLRPGMYCDVRVQLKLGKGIGVPKEAVLDTGERQIVFVEAEGGRFEPRQVEIGKEGDDTLEIRKGLAAGERVVTSANFLVDSESRFQAAARDFGGERTHD
jgi:multidrug efflux pump subunit AcrA (membrane-fusion protein)